MRPDKKDQKPQQAPAGQPQQPADLKGGLGDLWARLQAFMAAHPEVGGLLGKALAMLLGFMGGEAQAQAAPAKAVGSLAGCHLDEALECSLHCQVQALAATLHAQQAASEDE